MDVCMDCAHACYVESERGTECLCCLANYRGQERATVQMVRSGQEACGRFKKAEEEGR